MKHFFILPILLICSNQHIKVLATAIGTVSPKQVRIVTGGSAQIKFYTLLPFEKCEVTTPKNNHLVYDKKFPNDTTIILNTNSTDRVSWLIDECGLILSSASTYSDGNWNFKVTTENNEVFADRSTFSILPQPNLEMEISASLGSSVQIDCNSQPVKPTYCTIFNNFGRIVSDECVYYIRSVTFNNFGKWICKIAVMGAMKEFNHTIVLKEIVNDVLRSEKNQTNTHLLMSCSLLESRYSLNWCRAVKPNGEKLLLTQGLVTDRYSAFETNVQQKKCSIEIKLPLLKEEIGQWRLELGQSSNDFTGCFIDTSVAKKRTIKKFVTPNQEVINISNGSPMKIKCSVPWPISYCYALDPVGNYTYATGFSANRMQKIGVCHVSIESMNTDLAGKWICGVSSDDGSNDIFFHKNVIVINDKIHTENAVQKVNIGDDVHLLCKSPIEESMRYCRFTSPSGESFLLQPASNSNEQRISYWGSSLSKGQCGIQLKNIQEKDIGVWYCITSFETLEIFEKKYSVGIIVENHKTTLAFTLGMSIGGLVFLALFIVILIKIYKNHKTAEARSEHRSPSVSSDEPLSSDNNINMYILGTPVHRRYTENTNQ